MSIKTLESLELAVAQKSLDDYSAALANGDVQSLKAVACQRLVQQGIDAFQWIVKAEETIRQAAYQGLIDFSPELDETLEALYRGWLARCEQMQALIRQQILQGGDLDNVSEFARCRDSARDWIERHAWRKASSESLARRSASEPW
ncbi:MAG TPA: hypothetical protein VNH11_08905 [Pirellulales bacterium]|nr:hypothetical protein [Pirellulales bacterium]